MSVLTVLRKVTLLSCHAGQSGARDVIAKLRYDWSNDVGSYLASCQVINISNFRNIKYILIYVINTFIYRSNINIIVANVIIIYR